MPNFLPHVTSGERVPEPTGHAHIVRPAESDTHLNQKLSSVVADFLLRLVREDQYCEEMAHSVAWPETFNFRAVRS